MKLKSKPLLDALKLLRPVTGRSLPILSCFRIEAVNNGLTVTATDCDQMMTEVIDCEGDLEALCISADWLLNAIAGETTTLELADKVLTVKGGGNVTKIPTLDAAQFPPPLDDKGDKQIFVSCEDVGAAIKAVRWCESEDENHGALCGTHILGTPKMLKVNAADGTSGAFWNQPLICASFEVLVPGDFSATLAEAMVRANSELHISDNYITVIHPNGSYRCKQSEYKFPGDGVERLQQEPKTEIGTLTIKPLVDALTVCCHYTKPNTSPVAALLFSGKGIAIEFLGAAEINADVPGGFKNHGARVNCNALLHCLRGVGSDTCKIYKAESKLVLESGNLCIHSMNLRV